MIKLTIGGNSMERKEVEKAVKVGIIIGGWITIPHLELKCPQLTDNINYAKRYDSIEDLHAYMDTLSEVLPLGEYSISHIFHK